MYVVVVLLPLNSDFCAAAMRLASSLLKCPFLPSSGDHTETKSKRKRRKEKHCFCKRTKKLQVPCQACQLPELLPTVTVYLCPRHGGSHTHSPRVPLSQLAQSSPPRSISPTRIIQPGGPKLARQLVLYSLDVTTRCSTHIHPRTVADGFLPGKFKYIFLKRIGPGKIHTPQKLVSARLVYWSWSTGGFLQLCSQTLLCTIQ